MPPLRVRRGLRPAAAARLYSEQEDFPLQPGQTPQLLTQAGLQLASREIAVRIGGVGNVMLVLIVGLPR